jgi:glycine oxidase
MFDILIVGGGVIGLSLAYELARRGRTVRLLDRGAPGQEASWAGAGLLPPARADTAPDPYEKLAGISHALHPQWADTLRGETGIDSGFRRTGSIHLARDHDAAELLRAAAEGWRGRKIAVEELDLQSLQSKEPRLADGIASSLRAACLLPDEAQLRNPRHLKALLLACQARGVRIDAYATLEDFERHSGRVVAVRTTSERIPAGAICLCTGPWTATLARRLGVVLPMTPVRGQIVLLSSEQLLLRHIVNEGRRYLVPRGDGRILVGSTEEHAGFDKRATAEGVGGLVDFALGLVPELGNATLERAWAGLRPSTPDGLPYLGRLADLENVFVAAGHYRGGIHLSTGTAVVVAELIEGQTPQVDLSAFSHERFARTSQASPFVA